MFQEKSPVSVNICEHIGVNIKNDIVNNKN